MRKFLIPLFILSGISLFAQEPVAVQFSKVDLSSNQIEMPCNDAGTITRGQFIGQSNDFSGDTIYFCSRDSLFIQHNQDTVFAPGTDPTNPAIPRGVAYAFYDCVPTVEGPNLLAVDNDPCVIDDISTGNFFVANGQANGDIWFWNSGTLNQNPAFGGNVSTPLPVDVHLAPITVYDFGELNPWGAGSACIAVSVDQQIPAVYLTPINIGGVAVDGCRGRFLPSGGYFEYNNNSTYDISIVGVDNPAAEVHFLNEFNPGASGTPLNFSVEESGRYRITVEDGKSCGKDTVVTMNACNEPGNVGFQTPSSTGLTGTNVCIPIVLEQGQPLINVQFSLEWDETVLTYDTIVALNGLMVFPNTNLVATGRLGGIIDNNFNLFPQVTGETLLEVCFDVIGTSGQCSPLNIIGSPTALDAINPQGSSYGISLDNGQFCVVTPGVVDAEILLDSIDCQGNAQLIVIPSDGVPPYEIIYNGPSNGITTVAAGDTAFINISDSGTYTIDITDANGAGTTISRVFNADIPQYGVNLDFTQPECSNGTDGAVSVEIILNNIVIASPGPEFSYNWTGVSIPNPGQQTQSPVPSGAYAVTVTNSTYGCSLVASGALSEPAPMTRDNAVIAEASCSGVEDGGLEYSVMGGTPINGSDYSYSWNYSASNQPPGDVLVSNIIAQPYIFTNRAAGTYYVTVSDLNGCSFVDSVEITAQKELTLNSLTQTNVTCFGLTDGTVSLELTTNPITATEPYTFMMMGGSVGIVQNQTGQQTSDFSNIPAGMYTFIASEDDSQCEAEIVITITQPTELDLDTVQLQNPTCAQGTNGLIEVGATGGTAPTYTYAWSDMNTGISNGSLPPGNYTVTVTDQLGCLDSLEFDLALPNPPSLVFDSTSVMCGEDGCVSVTATPNMGSTIASYQWQDLGQGIIVGTMDEVCGLSGGSFQVIVTDSESCVSIDTVDLFIPDLIQLDAINTQLPSCFGSDDGIIGVTMSGGQIPYSYMWEGSTIDASALTNITSGTYGLTVSDALGCSLDTMVMLEDPLPIFGLPLLPLGVSCPNSTDGAITYLAQYWDGVNQPVLGDFTFQWENSTSMDSIVTNLPGGFQTVTISDQNNCFIIDTFLIDTVPQIVGTNSTFVPVSCFGGDNGVALASGSGGNGGPYTYEWAFDGSTMAQLPMLEAGAYEVTIFDANGCEDTHIISVAQPDPIMVQDSIIDIICANDGNGQLFISATGGNPGGYTYEWDQGLGNSPTLVDVAPGTYGVTVTDIEGCQDSTEVTLNNPPPVVGEILPWDELMCFGDQTTLFVDTIYGGVGGPYQFTLDFGVELPVDFPVSMSGGWHVVSYLDRLGCASEDSIFVDEPEEITVVFPETLVEVELGDTTYQLLPTINPPNVAAFEWTNGGLLSSDSILNPYAYNNETTTFTLMVTNDDGCMGEGSITVEIDPNRNIYIPNIFNPASTNGFNDRFTPYTGFGVTRIQLMQVYDRWGNLMYERTNFLPDNNDFSEGWDGRYKGKRANPGVYVYVVKVLFRDGRVLNYRGDVTLIR